MAIYNISMLASEIEDALLLMKETGEINGVPIYDGDGNVSELELGNDISYGILLTQSTPTSAQATKIKQLAYCISEKTFYICTALGTWMKCEGEIPSTTASEYAGTSQFIFRKCGSMATLTATTGTFGATSGSTVLTIPEGFRPVSDFVMSSVNSTNGYYFNVRTDGKIIPAFTNVGYSPKIHVSYFIK